MKMSATRTRPKRLGLTKYLISILAAARRALLIGFHLPHNCCDHCYAVSMNRDSYYVEGLLDTSLRQTWYPLAMEMDS